MKKILLLTLTCLLFISCNSNQFENKEIKIDNLNGYTLTTTNEGVIPTIVNGKSIESANPDLAEYVISKSKIYNTNNHLRIRSIDLQGVPEEEYLTANLEQLPEYYPPFVIERNVHDTIVNAYKGQVFTISIDLGSRKMEQSIFVLKSNTDKAYRLISTIIDNDEAAKSDFKNIISTLTLK